MQKYFDSVIDKEGRPIKGASVLVTANNGSSAPIYSDNDKTPLANPILTNDQGYFEFYAPDGRYDITLSGAGLKSQVIRDVLIREGAEAVLTPKSVTLTHLSDDVVTKLNRVGSGWDGTWGGGGTTTPTDPGDPDDPGDPTYPLEPYAIACLGGNLFYSPDPTSSDPEHNPLAKTVPDKIDEEITSHSVVNESSWWFDTNKILIGQDKVHPPLIDWLKTAQAKWIILSSCIEDAYAVPPISTVQYRANLEQIVTLVRARGMTMLFATPNKTDDSTPDSYRAVMKEVATAKSVPVIDVYAYTASYALGNGGVYSLCGTPPNGYLLKESAVELVGRFIAEEFAKIDPNAKLDEEVIYKPPPPPGIWPLGRPQAEFAALTLNEEFNGNALDTNLWCVNKLWYTVPNKRTFSVSNGRLNMWYEQPYPGQQEYLTFTTDKRQGIAGFEQTYGYFEMKAKLPKGRGSWPAFWLFNWSHDSANQREIDIMEAWGTNGGSGNDGWTLESNPGVPVNIQAATHNVQGSNNVMLWSRRYNPDGSSNWITDLTTTDHVYGCKWSNNKIEFFFDGHLYATYTHNNSFFNVPMFIMLDIWNGGYIMGGSNMLSTDNSITPQGSSNSFSIEYVRVWTLANQDGTALNKVAAVYGDSTVKGYTGSTYVTSPWPKVFATTENCTAYNEGVNSTTAAQLLAGTDGVHAAWDTELNRRPSINTILIQHCGSADAADPTAYKTALTSLVTKAKAKGKKVVLVTPNPASFITGPTWAPMVKMKEVGTEQGIQVIDVYAHLMTTYGSVEAICPDGVHPSQAAYTTIGNYVAAQLA